MQVQKTTPPYQPYSALPNPSFLALNLDSKPFQSSNFSTTSPEVNLPANPDTYCGQLSFVPLVQGTSSFLIPQNNDFPFCQSLNYSYYPLNNHLSSQINTTDNRISKELTFPRNAFNSCENNISSVLPIPQQYFNSTVSSRLQDTDKHQCHRNKEIKQSSELLYANDISITDELSTGQMDNIKIRVDAIIEKAKMKIESQHNHSLMAASVVESVKRYIPEYVSYDQERNSFSMFEDSSKAPELSSIEIFAGQKRLTKSSVTFSGFFLDQQTSRDNLNTQRISSARQSGDIEEQVPDQYEYIYSTKFPSFSDCKNTVSGQVNNPEKTKLDILIQQGNYLQTSGTQQLQQNQQKQISYDTMLQNKNQPLPLQRIDYLWRNNNVQETTQNCGILDFIINDDFMNKSIDKQIFRRINDASFVCSNEKNKQENESGLKQQKQIDGYNSQCNLLAQDSTSSRSNIPLNLAAPNYGNDQFQGKERNYFKDSQVMQNFQPLTCNFNALDQIHSPLCQIDDNRLSLVSSESESNQKSLLKQQESIRIAEFQIYGSDSSYFTSKQAEIKETQIKEEGYKHNIINRTLVKYDQNERYHLANDKDLMNQLQQQSNNNDYSKVEESEKTISQDGIQNQINGLKSQEKDILQLDYEDDELARKIMSNLNKWMDPTHQNFIKTNFSRQQKRELIQTLSKQIQNDCEVDSIESKGESYQDCFQQQWQEKHAKNTSNSTNILKSSDDQQEDDQVALKEINTEPEKQENIKFSQNCLMESQNQKGKELNTENEEVNIIEINHDRSQEREVESDVEKKNNKSILDENASISAQSKLLLQDIYNDVQHALKKYDQIITESSKNKRTSSLIGQGITTQSKFFNDSTLMNNKMQLFLSFDPSQTEIPTENKLYSEKQLLRSNSMKNISQRSEEADSLIRKLDQNSQEKSDEQEQQLINHKTSNMEEQNAENDFQRRRQQIYDSLKYSSKMRRAQRFLSQKPMYHSSNKINIGFQSRTSVRTPSSSVSSKNALGFSGQYQEMSILNGSGIKSCKVKASVLLDKVLTPKGRYQKEMLANGDKVYDRVILEQEKDLQQEKKNNIDNTQQIEQKTIKEKLKDELLLQQKQLEDHSSSVQQYNSDCDTEKVIKINESNLHKLEKIFRVLQIDISEKESKGEGAERNEDRNQKDQEKEPNIEGNVQVQKQFKNEYIRRGRKGLEGKNIKSNSVLKQESQTKQEKLITYLRQSTADTASAKPFENEKQQIIITNKIKQTGDMFLTENLYSQESILGEQTQKSIGDVNILMSQSSKSEGDENSILKISQPPLSMREKSKGGDNIFHLKRLAILNDIEDLNRQIEMEKSYTKRDKLFGQILVNSLNNMENNCSEQMEATKNSLSQDSVLFIHGDSVESKDKDSHTGGSQRDQTIEKIPGNLSKGQNKRTNKDKSSYQLLAKTAKKSKPSIPLEQNTQEGGLRVRGKNLQKDEGYQVKGRRGKSAAVERENEHGYDKQDEKQEKQLQIDILQATVSKGNKMLGNFEKRNEQWIQARKNKMQKATKTLTNQQMKECTFMPQTNQFHSQCKQSLTSKSSKVQHKQTNSKNHNINQSQNNDLLAKLFTINERLVSQKQISSLSRLPEDQLKNIPARVSSSEQQGVQSPIMQRFSDVEFWSQNQSDESVFKVIDLDNSIQQELKKEINEVFDIIQGFEQTQKIGENKPLETCIPNSKDQFNFELKLRSNSSGQQHFKFIEAMKED